MLRKIVIGVLWALLVPYIVTLAWTGTVEGSHTKAELASGKRILMDGRSTPAYIDVEEYLIGVVGKQIPAEYEEEAIRAQAVVARTYIYRTMGDHMEIPESSLDLDYIEEKQMEQLWGSENFLEYYKKLEQAVLTTKGMVLTYEGNLIEPLFHRASAGMTRSGDEQHPYLVSVASQDDMKAEGYVSTVTFGKEEFVNRINQIPDGTAVTAEEIPETIQLIEKEDAGYVKQIQIGTKAYTGEEVQYALGLASPSFVLESYEGNIRAVCQGIGHGYGLSQYGANAKAAQGWKAEDILSYFYKNIVIISE